MPGIRRVEPCGLPGHKEPGQEHRRTASNLTSRRSYRQGRQDGQKRSQPQRGEPGPQRVSLRAAGELLTDSVQEAERTSGRQQQQTQGGRNRTLPPDRSRHPDQVGLLSFPERSRPGWPEPRETERALSQLGTRPFPPTRSPKGEGPAPRASTRLTGQARHLIQISTEAINKGEGEWTHKDPGVSHQTLFYWVGQKPHLGFPEYATENSKQTFSK